MKEIIKQVSSMNIRMKSLVLTSALTLLVACGGGGGDRAPGVEPGPDAPGGPVTPPAPDIPSSELSKTLLTVDDQVVVAFTAIDITSDPVLTFTVRARNNQMVTGVVASEIRYSMSQVANFNENGVTKWTSFIQTSEDPVCRSQSDVDKSTNQCTTFTSETDPSLIADSARKVQDPVAVGKELKTQATAASNGTLTANADGSYSYAVSTSVGDVSALHRVCFQFSLKAPTNNACIDFVPEDLVDEAIGDNATSLNPDFYENYTSREIATEASCNACHNKLALHGGGRTSLQYCVACHNPDTTDANSGQNLSLSVLVHKVHFAKNLPSKIDDGIAYKIWGYNNSEHDFSNLSYPQSVMNCTSCHAGAEDVEFAEIQGLPMPAAVITADGHNWVTRPSIPACGACHEKFFTENIKLDGSASIADHTAFDDARNCTGCHRDRGADAPGALQANQAHRQWIEELGRSLTLNITAVSATAATQTPVVTFNVTNTAGDKIDLQDPAVMCSDAKFDLRMPYDASTEFIGRLSSSGTPATLVALGGNDFSVSPSAPVPADVDTIAAMLDWNFKFDCSDGTKGTSRIDAATFYAPSTASVATPRRTIVDVANCNQCHERFLLTNQKHSGTRSVNDPAACVACHNAGFAASDRTREMATLVHALHAPAIRENPHGPYTTDELQYPGDLANCSACHANNSYRLPLPVDRLPIKVSSTTYTSATAAICGGCHDNALAASHMVSAGGAVVNGDQTEAGNAIETCAVCHRSGATADLDVVHNR